MENLVLSFMENYWSDLEVIDYCEIFDTVFSIQPDWGDNLQTYMLSIGEDKDTDIVSDNIRSMVRGMLIELLNDIGVITQEDYILDNSTLFQIYREMISIEDNEQVEFSLSILESEDDEVTVFYELLSTIGTLTIDEDEFNKHVKKISPFTKEKLISYLMNLEFTEPIKDNSEVDTIGISVKVKQFISKINDDQFMVIDLIRNGVNIGLDLPSYMALYGNDILDLDIKESTYNLYLLGLISSDATNDVPGVLETVLPNYIFDEKLLDGYLRNIRQLQIKLGI